MRNSNCRSRGYWWILAMALKKAGYKDVYGIDIMKNTIKKS